MFVENLKHAKADLNKLTNFSVTFWYNVYACKVYIKYGRWLNKKSLKLLEIYIYVKMYVLCMVKFVKLFSTPLWSPLYNRHVIGTAPILN